MGFMKSLIGPIASTAASLIPGVGPVASKLISGLGGVASAGLGALGGSGQQSKMTQTQTESPETSQFRNGLFGTISDQIKSAQQPIYGDAQKAGYLSNLNDLANSSMKSLQGNLARVGGMGSGRHYSGLSDIAVNRDKSAAGFFSQLPFMEAQAQSQRLDPLLQIGAGLAGRSPLSTTSTMSGPNFGSNLASTLGGMGSNMFGSWWKKRMNGDGGGGGGSFGGGGGIDNPSIGGIFDSNGKLLGE